MTKLTPKQVEVLELIATGSSTQQTADVMGVTVSTVEKHLTETRVRLKARNRVHAVYLAAKSGIITLACVAVITAPVDSGGVERSRRISARRTRRDSFVTVTVSGFVAGLQSDPPQRGSLRFHLPTA